MTRFPGVLPALLTPFDERGEIDESRLTEHVDYVLDAGVHGLVSVGTMGEAGSMSRAERREVTRAIVAQAAGRAPVVAGIAAPTAAQAAEYGADAAQAGAQAVMLLPPLVYEADERELLHFYRTVGEAIDLPIMLYNNPKASGAGDLGAALIASLAADVEGLVAVKECSADARRIAALQEADAEILVGGDDWALEGFFAGATGWISGVANVAPRECVTLFEQCAGGEIEAARRTYQALLPLCRLDMRPKLVQYYKAAGRVMGRDLGRPRPPRLELTEAEELEVVGAVEALRAFAEPSGAPASG